jgi:glycosyltransferase involved in cell wall biosynthesis
VVGSEIGVELLVGYVAARTARRTFVIGVHADLDEALREWVPRRLHRLFYWVHRHADGAVCVAPALVAPLVRNGLAPERVRTVRNGIDPGEIRRSAEGPGSLVRGDLPVVVATGRLARQKGYDLLLAAHARVVPGRPHRLLILNDGPELASLQAMARSLGVAASVEFAGAVSAPLPSVAHADLFCLPSRHEGLPLALLEALVLGVPVIAADCSEGVRDALDQGRVGELVPVEDVDALAAALARHLADPSRLRERARLGPAHADTFDGQAMAEGWAAALRDFMR